MTAPPALEEISQPRESLSATDAVEALAPRFREYRARPERLDSGFPTRRRVTRLEGLLIFLVSAGLYAWAAWWLSRDYHFYVGDALARTLDAKLVVWSRDPHLAAIGVYWMPLPTFAQVPLVALTQLLGVPEYAGPLSSALFSAGTMLIIVKMGRDFGLNRLSSYLVALAYGANPVIVYYAANGMSESCEFFCLALAMWGLLRYLRDNTAGSAGLAGVGLALLALAKYEAAPVVVVFVLAVVLTFGRRLRRERHAVLVDVGLVALPPVLSYVFWLAYNKLILGSWTAFLKVNLATQGGSTPIPAVGAGTTPAIAPAPQVTAPRPALGTIEAAKSSVEGTLDFLLHNVLAFGPSLLIIIPLLLLPRWRRTIGGLTIVLTAAGVVAATTVLAYRGGTYGNPRYYVPLTPVVVFAVLWSGHRVRRWGQLFVTPVMVALLILTAITGTRFEQRSQSPEYENRVFSLVSGHYDHITTLGGLASVPGFRQVSDHLDALLKPHEYVLCDSRFNGTVELLSEKPRQFIINADRDYQSIVDPSGGGVRINYAVVTAPNAATYLQQDGDDAFNLVGRDPSQWTLVYQNDIAQIFKRNPAVNAKLPPPSA